MIKKIEAEQGRYAGPHTITLFMSSLFVRVPELLGN